MPTLAEIRAKLQKQDNRSQTNFTSGDNYPFWNIPNDEQARIRFLPDANEDNTFFWVEKQMIRLTFPGVKGADESKQIFIDVPCAETWGETCPILTETRPWWNDDSLKDTARKYWKKRSYIFQGYVIDSPLKEESEPENPIRRFVVSPQIFKLIKSSLLDPDFENIPTDYINGTDFIICKTQKGDYADYTTSKWARKETALTEEQLDAIEEYKLRDLTTFLPKQPTAEHLNAQFEMFEASLAGELYDPTKWAKYYRPYGLEYEEKAEDKKAPASTPKVTVESSKSEDASTSTPAKAEEKTESAPAPGPSDAGEKSAQDILAMIRNRNN